MIAITPKLNTGNYFKYINNSSKVNSSNNKNCCSNSAVIENSANPISLQEIPSQKLGSIKPVSFGYSCLAPNHNEIKPECFFIRMKSYGKNKKWAEEMARIACVVSGAVRHKANFDKMLKYVCEEVRKINNNDKYGKLIKRYNKQCFSNWYRGEEYSNLYHEKVEKNHGKIIPQANIEGYKEANTAQIYDDIGYNITIYYGIYRKSESKNLDLCKKAYDELISLKNPSEDDILRTCAIIQWLIAQECPFWRGNDSIANLITKGIMHAYGLKITPIKKGKSLDFEAFYRNLDTYIYNYPYFFEEYPEKL